MTGPFPAGGTAPSPLQRGLWPLVRDAPARSTSSVRALRVAGHVDLERLLAAVDTVRAAFPIVDVALYEGPDGLRLDPAAGGSAVHVVDLRAAPDRPASTRAVHLLRAERDRVCGPHERQARFHLVRLADDDIVLALTAHQLVLDVTSLHLVLGAVWQAYFDRFRPSQYRPRGTVTDARADLVALRRGWWACRLGRLADGDDGPARPPSRRTGAERLVLDGSRWADLERAATVLGASAPIAVTGLVAWWLQASGSRRRIGFCADLDLRDVTGVGPVVGPFTDRAVYTVDLRAPGPFTLREILLGAQTGVLDAVVRYLPYDEIVDLTAELGLAAAPRTAALWDVVVHFCRNPPTSSVAARTETARQLGLGFELFAEADLVDAVVDVPADRWDGTNLDIRMAEHRTGLAVIAEFNELCFSRRLMQDMLADVSRAIDIVVRDPDIPLPTPSARTTHNGGPR